jgi:ABC-2 type transport system permease protein
MTSAALAYTRFELKRTFRNKRFMLFSFVFPVLLYLLVAGPNKNVANLQDTGLSAPLYFMVSMASWGTMTSVLSVGGRIAGERQTGWNRQLRISPLTARAYLRAKVLTSYMMALLSLVILYILGASFGVRLPAGEWLAMTGLIIVGLIPFAALGITIGHLVAVDSIGPVIGGGTSLLALLSGTWFPLGDSGFVHDLAQYLPSYWLVQANRVALGGSAWGVTGWVVVIAWGVALSVLAARVFRRDTARA